MTEVELAQKQAKYFELQQALAKLRRDLQIATTALRTESLAAQNDLSTQIKAIEDEIAAG